MIDKKQAGQSAGFAIKMMRETVAYPYILIKEPHRLGLDAGELLVLLRILHPYFAKGYLTREDIAKEFGVTPDEARVILMPFLEKGLLEENKKEKIITCDGVFTCYYEEWVTNQRGPCSNPELDNEPRMPEKDRQFIRDLARIYRTFEQEMGRNLTPIQSEEIRSWLEKDALAPDMIEEALRRSVLQEKRTFAYIKSILRKWREAGYTSLQEVLDNDHKPQGSASSSKKTATKRKKSKYSEIYDKY